MHSLSEQNYIQQVTVDCVIFGYQKQKLRVLIPKLNFRGDFYALPSGFVYQGEDVDEAAQRILQDRTKITNIYLAQFKLFGNADRNSKEFLDRVLALNPDRKIEEKANRREYEWFTQRFISIGYYALVDINQVVPQLNEIDQSIEWYDIKELPDLIMDHNQIVAKALQALRRNLDEKLTAFNLLPETFTMKEVQELYEAIFDKPFAMNNFQKKMLDLNVLERLEKKFTGAANKAPYLYRFQKDSVADA